MQLTFTTNFPPSVNHSHREIISRGRLMRVMRPEAAQFKHCTALIARNAAQLVGWQPSQRLAIRVALWMPRKGLDVDNRHKVLQDAIADGLGINDKFFRDVRIYEAGIDRINPRAEVTIEVLP